MGFRDASRYAAALSCALAEYISVIATDPIEEPYYEWWHAGTLWVTGHAAPHGSTEPSPQVTLPYIAPTVPSRAKATAATTDLTPREVEVVTLLAASSTNKEVSNLLNITVKTVETYRERIMSKLQIHSISELVRYAVRSHLIQP